ncbi:MAG: pyruvate, phosphate dikinase, partial [Phycisphaerales bacterium]
MPTAPRWVYSFGDGKADGSGDQRELLGGKGAGLAEMTRIGLPVPPGFTITTDACARYHRRGGKWPPGLDKQVRQALTKLERTCKKEFGATRDPLLVSVRSGAARSMPGMMETILNLGLNDRSVEGLAEVSASRRFALDAYRRLIMMYGSTAKGIRREHFENAFDLVKRARTGARLGRASDERVLDTDASAEELEQLVADFKRIYHEYTGEQFPQNPLEQLKGAIVAVFNSWMAEKAVTYRRVESITGLAGTAVNVCRMVFGNMGEDSGTGVCFTRDPSTGEAVFYGDMLINAQGEDVVAGIRTPMKLAELRTLMPEVYEQLQAVRVILEVHYRDMQDLEFTIERGKLYMLQCRVGKRSPVAAFKIAVDQATKGLMSPATARRLVKKKYLPKKYAAAAAKPVITKDQAIQRIEAVDIERLFYPVLDPNVPGDELDRRRLGQGIGAVPGAACGEVTFTAEDAEARAKVGAAVILVRKETSPEDVGGMYVSAGILTAIGGKTSHAAVVARGWGKCCIVGCGALAIDYNDKSMMLGTRVLREGDAITLDGTMGRIFEGRVDLVRPDAPPEYHTLMSWCDKRRRLKVYTNADTPSGAERGLDLGAEGIGLCRTEHMFFDSSQPQRIRAMREMILAETPEHRRRVLEKLLPYQRKDFEGIFTAMHGRPVTIRLLDPPLHEFLPHHDNPAGQQAVADELNESAPYRMRPLPPTEGDVREAFEAKRMTIDDIRRRVDQLRETNPMLGHRGCRLCISYPEILEMQVRAIIEAAVNCARNGTKVLPEIMIP